MLHLILFAQLKKYTNKTHYGYNRQKKLFFHFSQFTLSKMYNNIKIGHSILLVNFLNKYPVCIFKSRKNPFLSQLLLSDVTRDAD